MDRFKLPALDTLQDRLSGNAEDADPLSGEAQARGSAAPLLVEDASDHGIRVMCCQTTHQVDCLLVGAHSRWWGRLQGHIHLAEEASVPAQRKMGLLLLSIES